MTALAKESARPATSRDAAAGEFYIPEKLTSLVFTGIYTTLSDWQRVRYNQLFGLYFLEQTIFFEQCMGRPALERIEQIAPAHLRVIARQFIDEENRHTAWFRELLRECDPRRYSRDAFCFVKAGPAALAALRFCARQPRLFPCLLWLQLIAEERAQCYSGAFVAGAETLDPRFVEVQRKHLADEAGHIRWDTELIEWLWPATPLYLRKANAQFLAWLLREFFLLPKRSNWNVVEQFLAEFPELAARKPEFHSAMQSLAQNESYIRSLYPRAVYPRTRRLASRWPELHFLDQFFTD
jgi:hypothetical protein